jgi:hypothetical protein
MDIRLVRGRNQRLWLWTAVLVVLAIAAWGSVYLIGDATRPAQARLAGEKANFGAERGEVLPMHTEEFDRALPLEERELGRLLHLTGWAESEVRANAVWVRTTSGRRILVRFEPPPPGRPGIYAGGRVDVLGYLQKISRAELEAWLDSVGVRLPRPRPGVKFGDLPDSTFARIDSLFVRRYYLSVRPEGLRGGRGAAPGEEPPPPPPPAAARPAPPAREERPAPAEERPAPAPVPADTEETPAPPPPAPPDTTRPPR